MNLSFIEFSMDMWEVLSVKIILLIETNPKLFSKKNESPVIAALINDNVHTQKASRLLCIMI